jgi:hypothetical protein
MVVSGVLVQGVFFEECAGADVALLGAVGAIKRSRTWQRARKVKKVERWSGYLKTWLMVVLGKGNLG